MAPSTKSTKTTQLRRNERERKRVHQVNDGFDQLRTRVPKAIANKKLSKADTLREAAKYIQYLQSILHGNYPQASGSVSYPSSCSQQTFYSDMDMDMYFPPQSVQTSPVAIGANPQLGHAHISPAHSDCGMQIQQYQPQYQQVMRPSP